MMKTILFIVLALVALFIVKLVIARRKFTKQWKQDEDDALQISRKMYEPLSLSERYAFVFVFDIFMKNIRTSVHNLAIAHHQIEFESKALGVTVKDADSFFCAEGVDRGITHSMDILRELKNKNRSISDFLVYRCSTFVKKACGRDRQTGMDCREISEKLFIRMFTSIGYTEDELAEISNNPQKLISLFGREKLV
jgi:hypothetical protein